jgi:transcriptional regulator with XRE-family HTH domain
MAISAEQIRMVRGALRFTVRDLEELTGVDKTTIVRLEGGGRPYSVTVKKLMVALEPYVEFIDADGMYGPGIKLKRGYEAVMRGAGHGATQADDASSLSAMAWDAEDYPTGELPRIEPIEPLDWSDDDKRAQIEHWRSRPERWAALAEVSRQCLLRAMGLERL